MPKKAASGSGSIRRREVVKNGRKYYYWEGRYVAGRNPLTGKPIRKSISGKTQKEVAQKLREVISSGDASAYNPNQGITVAQWLNIWLDEYSGEKKASTVDIYRKWCDCRIIPALGNIKLENLHSYNIQHFYNGLKSEISANTIRSIHALFHCALTQAVRSNIIPKNPADACVLPKAAKREITPVMDEDVSKFFDAIKGHQFEDLYTVDFFTGLRLGEILGLTWDCVDFQTATICVDKQLARIPKGGGAHELRSTKKDNIRYIAVPGVVIECLKKRKAHQEALLAEDPCTFSNSMNLVFTDDTGKHLARETVYQNLKKIYASIGLPNSRFHDLRHSYAVALLEADVDIKTIQSNLGHSNISTTLDVYAHVTQKLKKESADKLENFIKSLRNQP